MYILKPIFIIILVLCTVWDTNAQGFLHTNGKNIVNGEGENVILRGIGTGNWMLMEGYMMKTEGVAGTQHEIKARLEELMGEEKTNEFFNTWLENHFTKTDVDSMKAWGFNSIRVAMHYKWFTLPIEEEPITGNNTLVYKGFKMIDDLLQWCESNQMYLILDLHGAPGGQGANADISDYDPSKPSLWESDENKAKTVFLWKELAKRYKDKPWIGGYDLINETNWTFPEGDNTQMRDLFEKITEAIREVDKNHIIFIEGNSFANDHTGLTPPWDNNMVYSFHKYWSGTTSSDLDWIIALRDEHNVPLWMGESGENSNTWFTDLIALCEQNNIGWSWWPVKKNGINNVLNVPVNKEYEDLVKYWKGENSTTPTATQTFEAVMQWAENHRIENCTVQYDVIDALIRQPHTNDVKPYHANKLNAPVFFSDFDMGKNGIAYSDKDVAYYGGTWSAWNNGWGLRNDGVDIEKCNDKQDTTNGYNVGWTEEGEWMQYTMKSDSTAIYQLAVRHASGSSGSKFHIEVNGAKVTGELSLPGTGGWQNWQTASFDNIVIPAGNIKIKYQTSKGGSNLSYFKFVNPKSASSVELKAENGATSENGQEIFLSLNKEITSTAAEIAVDEFQVKVNNNTIPVLSVVKDTTLSSVLIIKHNTTFYSDNEITVSYHGTSVKSGSQKLKAFTDLTVQNNLPVTHLVPGQIQAEDFSFNNGLALENCSDQNGGKNTAYSAPGEYLEYHVHIAKTGTYALKYRVATQHTNAEVIFQTGDGNTYTSIDTLMFSATGGWQNWETQSTSVHLEEGYHYIRILIKNGEHNLNWFQLDLLTKSPIQKAEPTFHIYPNPAKEKLTIDFSEHVNNPAILKIININGVVVKQQVIQNKNRSFLNLEELHSGFYILRVEQTNKIKSKRFIISR